MNPHEWASLLSIAAPMDLGPGRPDLNLKSVINELTLPKNDMGECCRSGIWLLHDFLDESHAISQEIDTPSGSYWHAIMHRREPDASNSKYWWRRVGSHPVLDSLKREAPGLGYDFTTPYQFVDFCERVRGTGSPDESLARCVQMLEWQLLFDYCHRISQH